MPTDHEFIEQAVRLALKAEQEGNLPIGALIVLGDQVISSGKNTMLKPHFHPGAHAEMVTLSRVPLDLWPKAKQMTCYSTLEPCLMCFGALLLHGIGRVVFGAVDRLGGAGYVLEHLPPFYSSLGHHVPQWIGPIQPSICDPLYQRAHEMYIKIDQKTEF